MRIHIALFALVLAGCSADCKFGPGTYHYCYRVASGCYMVSHLSTADVSVVFAPDCPDWQDTVSIPSRVDQVAWDDRFVIARQRPPAQSTIRYWILDAKEHRLHGPLDDLPQLEAARLRFGVPANLVLRNVDDYPHSMKECSKIHEAARGRFPQPFATPSGGAPQPAGSAENRARP